MTYKRKRKGRRNCQHPDDCRAPWRGPCSCQITDTMREALRWANKGYKHTPEHNAAISKARKGQPITDEQRKRLQTMNIGRKQTAAHVHKRIEAQRKRDT